MSQFCSPDSFFFLFRAFWLFAIFVTNFVHALLSTHHFSTECFYVSSELREDEFDSNIVLLYSTKSFEYMSIKLQSYIKLFWVPKTKLSEFQSKFLSFSLSQPYSITCKMPPRGMLPAYMVPSVSMKMIIVGVWGKYLKCQTFHKNRLENEIWVGSLWDPNLPYVWSTNGIRDNFARVRKRYA